jgi:hypothetical protein
MKRRLLADIVGVTPSSFENFTRCGRRFFLADLLGTPVSDPGPPNDQGMFVHEMLCRIHETGSCADDAHVREVLTLHGDESDHMRTLIRQHEHRCPAAASTRDAHEQELARFHRLPPPMFMATARIDAIWIHDGLLDARDYKTGGLWHTRVADVPAARVQAFVLGAAAAKRGLRLRLRYEYLQPEFDEDPEPWEPDADDLVFVEEELRSAVEHMKEQVDWTGVAEADVCVRCPYRSICRDSAAPGEPSWPVLAVT